MAGNVVSNVKKYYGGQVPVPGQGDSDGKVKVLVEMTTTMEIGGVQTDVDLLYDADDLATPVTPQKLGQWTDENYLIVFKTKDADGKVRGFILYALETTSTSTDTLVNNATFVAFKGLETDPGASAFMFTMVEDSSTLSRYLRDENGELTVKFTLSCVDEGAQSGPLSELIGTDSSLMNFEVVYDEGNAYLMLNTEGLMDDLEGIWAWIGDFIDRFDELPSDEHGYFNSSLYQTPGDGTTTSLNMDNFRISAGRDVHGDNIEFVPTHQEDGVDFGEVYLEPGTYIFTVDYTLQWVGSPRGTFLPRVANVGERPFDFSYEHEDALRTTRIVTKTARGKFGLNFPFDADTPPMGIWVKRLEIAQIASYNHPAVTHDTTLTGSGQIGDPLGVTTDVFGKVKDIPTSISQFRNGDVIPVDGPNGPAKMPASDLMDKLVLCHGSLADHTAPYDDLNTFPNNEVILVSTDIDSVANKPTNEAFNVATISNNRSSSAKVQILTTASNQVFIRSMYGYTYGEWINLSQSITPVGPKMPSGDYLDLNTFPRNEVVYIQGDVTSVLNRPTDELFSAVTICNSNTSSVKLQIVTTASNKIFVRSSYGGIWGGWNRIDSGADKFRGNPLIGVFQNILFIGDSLTWSEVWTADNAERQAYSTYPDVFARLCSSSPTVMAVRGYTAKDWWDNYGASLTTMNRALAIVYLGTNSGLTDTLDIDAPENTDPSTWADTNTGSYAKIINKLKMLGYKVICVKPWITGGNLSDTKKVITEVAERFNCCKLDAPVNKDKKYHYYPDLRGYNGVHYNDMGYSWFATALIDALAAIPESDTNNSLKYLIPD